MYRAGHPKAARDVAIKALSRELSQGKVPLAGFEREAQLLAGSTIQDRHSVRLAMEFVEGQTLAR